MERTNITIYNALIWLLHIKNILSFSFNIINRNIKFEVSDLRECYVSARTEV